MSWKITVLLGLALGVAAGAGAWWYGQKRTASDETVPTRRGVDTTPAGRKRSGPPAGTRDPPAATHSPESDVHPLLSRVVNSGPMARPRDAFRVIDRPKYLSVEQAADSMSDDEVVLGLELDGECRAYPINYLNDHELVREQIGDTPLLVSW